MRRKNWWEAILFHQNWSWELSCNFAWQRGETLCFWRRTLWITWFRIWYWEMLETYWNYRDRYLNRSHMNFWMRIKHFICSDWIWFYVCLGDVSWRLIWLHVLSNNVYPSRWIYLYINSYSGKINICLRCSR